MPNGHVTLLRERVRELAAAISATRSECEYTAMRDMQPLNERILKLERQLSDAKAEIIQRGFALAEQQASAREREERVLRELEALHEKARALRV